MLRLAIVPLVRRRVAVGPDAAREERDWERTAVLAFVAAVAVVVWVAVGSSGWKRGDLLAGAYFGLLAVALWGAGPAGAIRPLGGAVHAGFAAATGLRPAELFALEHRDLDLKERAVYVRRAYANGRVKHVKTRRSMRGVPLQGMALEALRRLPANPETALVFPNACGGYIDLHNVRQRDWRPALKASGIEPLRQPYDLRHTYATFGLRAGLSAFELSRYMGTSVAMIDLRYGHPASDGRQHAVALLDALAREKLVDAGWTPPPPCANPLGNKQRKPRRSGNSHSRGRSVDVARKTRRDRDHERRR